MTRRPLAIWVAAALVLAGARAQAVEPSEIPTAIAHIPPHLSFAGQPIEIEAHVACRDGAGACVPRLGYRQVSADALAEVAPFTEVPMSPRPDVPAAGAVATYVAQIPAEVVTTRGVDYYVLATDSTGRTRWPPGVAEAPLTLNGVGTYYRMDVLAAPNIVHEPAAAVAVGHPVTVRFQAPCAATRTCSATVWYRQTPIGGSQLLFGEPDWPTAPVRTLTITPSGSALSTYLFEAEIPGSAVDSRGVDYLIKVTDGDSVNYWPGAPYDAWVGTIGPLVSWHVAALSPPVIVHAPTPLAPVSADVEVTWRATCSTPRVADCDTAAFWRPADPLPALGAGPFTRLPTETEVSLDHDGLWVLRARAVISAGGTHLSREQYYLWATDGKTDTYSPGTLYSGHGAALDGMNLGQIVT